MSDFSNALAVTASGLEAQSQRLRHVAENIANSDTPGFRRKTITFESAMGIGATGEVQAGKVRLDPSELTRIFEPTHPLADETGHYESSNVNLVIEMADAREAQRSYEANLKMFDQTRQMSSSLLELLRK